MPLTEAEAQCGQLGLTLKKRIARLGPRALSHPSLLTLIYIFVARSLSVTPILVLSFWAFLLLLATMAHVVFLRVILCNVIFSGFDVHFCVYYPARRLPGSPRCFAKLMRRPGTGQFPRADLSVAFSSML